MTTNAEERPLWKRMSRTHQTLAVALGSVEIGRLLVDLAALFA